MPVGLQIFRTDGSIQLDTNTQLCRIVGSRLLTQADLQSTASGNGGAYRDYFIQFTVPTISTNIGRQWNFVSTARNIGELMDWGAPTLTVTGNTFRYDYGTMTSTPQVNNIYIRWGAY